MEKKRRRSSFFSVQPTTEDERMISDDEQKVVECQNQMIEKDLKTPDVKEYLGKVKKEKQDWRNYYKLLREKNERLRKESETQPCEKFDYLQHLDEDNKNFITQVEQEIVNMRHHASLEEMAKDIVFLHSNFDYQMRSLALFRENLVNSISDACSDFVLTDELPTCKNIFEKYTDGECEEEPFLNYDTD